MSQHEPQRWALYRTVGFTPDGEELRVEPAVPTWDHTSAPTPERSTVDVIEGDDATVPTGEVFEGDEAGMLERLTALHEKTGDSHSAIEFGRAFTLEQYAAECAACKVEMKP